MKKYSLKITINEAQLILYALGSHLELLEAQNEDGEQQDDIDLLNSLYERVQNIPREGAAPMEQVNCKKIKLRMDDLSHCWTGSFNIGPHEFKLECGDFTMVLSYDDSEIFYFAFSKEVSTDEKPPTPAKIKKFLNMFKEYAKECIPPIEQKVNMYSSAAYSVEYN